MKKWLLCFFIPTFLYASNAHTLNVFNWSGYMPQSVIDQFQKETGITLHYSTFDDNEELYTKLKLNPGVYDVIAPSSYMVKQMRDEDMLLPLDNSKIPNAKNLNPRLLNFSFDPHNQYSLPYTWGTVGIVINDQFYNPASVTSWLDLWDKRFRHQLLVSDETRIIFGIALSTLGYSINDQDPEHLKAANLQLKKLLPNVKIFNEAAEDSIYADDDATAGIALNGDAYKASLTNPHVHYIYPQGTTILWMDTIAIANHAPHIENAYRFINFVMRPDIAAKIAVGINYSTPNIKAIPLLPSAMRNSPILYPQESTLAQAEVATAQTKTTKRLLEHDWELLKLEE